MAVTPKNGERSSRFESISQDDLPQGRKGKHHDIVAQLLFDIEALEPGRALKVQVSELSDTMSNVRSALSRACKQRGLEVATSSDDEYFYGIYVLNSLLHKFSSTFLLTLVRESTTLNTSEVFMDAAMKSQRMYPAYTIGELERFVSEIEADPAADSSTIEYKIKMQGEIDRRRAGSSKVAVIPQLFLGGAK